MQSMKETLFWQIKCKNRPLKAFLINHFRSLNEVNDMTEMLK